MTFRGPVSRLRNLCLGCGVWGLGRGRLQGVCGPTREKCIEAGLSMSMLTVISGPPFGLR